MSSYALSKGANVGLGQVLGEQRKLIVVIETIAGRESVAPDASVLVLGEDKRVRSNADFIFYNQPTGADGGDSAGVVQ